MPAALRPNDTAIDPTRAHALYLATTGHGKTDRAAHAVQAAALIIQKQNRTTGRVPLSQKLALSFIVVLSMTAFFLLLAVVSGSWAMSWDLLKLGGSAFATSAFCLTIGHLARRER